MTGFTQQEFGGLLPHFEHAVAAYLRDAPLLGNPAQAGVIVAMTIVRYPR